MATPHTQSDRLDHYTPEREDLSEDLLDRIRVSCPGRLIGFDVWLVDGTVIRDELDVDFVEGGNPGRYQYVPEGEFWIESLFPGVDQAATMIHEATECVAMIDDEEDYSTAHDLANEQEVPARAEFPDGADPLQFAADWLDDHGIAWRGAEEGSND